MYGLTDYARFEAISSHPFSGDMLPSALMSKKLSLLPAGHEACFLLHGAFLTPLPADVRSHLIHDNTSDPLPYLSVPTRSTRVGFSPPPPSTTSIPHHQNRIILRTELTVLLHFCTELTLRMNFRSINNVYCMCSVNCSQGFQLSLPNTVNLEVSSVPT